MMPRTKRIQERKRAEAEKRNALYAALSVEEKLARNPTKVRVPGSPDKLVKA
jgi:hypothetical protein